MGPFIKNGEEYTKLANVLWDALVDTIPFKLNEYIFFVNEKNTLSRQFIESKNVIDNGHHFILRANRSILTDEQDIHIKAYDPSFHQSFSALHQLSFPNTYYSSEQILERTNEDNRLLTIQDNMDLMGYVYVEASPLHGEGAIEYIAVSPAYRGQGVATKLMKAALHYLFSFDGIEEISLSVEANNKAAIALYMATGFQVKHTMIAFKKIEKNYSDREVRSS